MPWLIFLFYMLGSTGTSVVDLPLLPFVGIPHLLKLLKCLTKHHNTSTSTTTRPRPRPDQTRPKKTSQRKHKHKTRPDQTKEDKTRQDKVSCVAWSCRELTESMWWCSDSCQLPTAEVYFSATLEEICARVLNIRSTILFLRLPMCFVVVFCILVFAFVFVFAFAFAFVLMPELKLHPVPS
jgi:hypothetical protein